MDKTFVYFDEYGPEFRHGYDVAKVIDAMDTLLGVFYAQNIVDNMYINIHKDSLSVCQGVCAENLFHTELKDPKKADENKKADNEVWLMITPSKMIKH